MTAPGSRQPILTGCEPTSSLDDTLTWRPSEPADHGSSAFKTRASNPSDSSTSPWAAFPHHNTRKGVEP
jgi:hypothetical protein